MTTIVFPQSMRSASADYSIAFDVQLTVMRNGRIDTYGLPGARWTVTIGAPNDTEGGQRPALEALLVSLKGGANRLSLGHIGRPIPNGTARGSITLQGSHAAGLEALNIQGISPATGTFKAGDMIGLPGQLLMVTADAQATGGSIANLQTQPALFQAYSNGAVVTWNRPQSIWIPKTNIAGPFPFRSGRSRPGFSFDLVETGP